MVEKNNENSKDVAVGAASLIGLGAAKNYIELIEKTAQSKWRRYIDDKVDKGPEGLADFASESTRNRRQIFDKPGNSSDVTTMGGMNPEERTKFIKQRLSSKDGFGRNKPPKSKAILDEMKDDVLRRKRIIRRKINNRKFDAEFLEEQYQKNPLNLSSSMDSSGSHRDAKPDDYIDIIHGGNRAKAEAFAKNGNGASRMETEEMLSNGKITENGLQFHSKVKERAPIYANMASEHSGGAPAVLKGRIKRKYVYPNDTQGNFSDEYGIPPEYFNKMENVEVYNPTTGKVYYERKGRSNALPHGRTTTPGAPSAMEKLVEINKNKRDFSMVGEGKLTTGRDTFIKRKPTSLNDFIGPSKPGPIKNNALVPYKQTELINKGDTTPLSGMTEKQKALKDTIKTRAKEKVRKSALVSRKQNNPFTDNISPINGMSEQQKILKDNIKARAKEKVRKNALVNQNIANASDTINKRKFGKLGAGVGLAGLGLGAGLGAYNMYKNRRDTYK